MQDNAIATPLEIAPLRIRLAALVYEALLVTAVLFVASFIILPLVGELKLAWQRLLFQGYLLLVLFGYFYAFWRKSGQTLAMKTWRIRLVNTAGGRLNLAQAGIRFLVAVVGVLIGFGIGWTLFDRGHQFMAMTAGVLLGGAGLWWALFDRDHQFLHDRLARTRLIRLPRTRE